MKKVLIAYVSKTGNTQTIAERIQQVLKQKGVETDIQRLAEVRNIEPYTCVLVGGPVQGMKWHLTAQEFVLTHRNQFQRKLLGYFYSSYFLLTARQGIRKRIENLFHNSASLPRADFIGDFGGKVNRTLSWVTRLLFGVPYGVPLDTIQWENVDAWAALVAQKVELRIAKEKRALLGILD